MSTVDNMVGYTLADSIPNPPAAQPSMSGDPSALHVVSTGSNLMSITGGNTVPMRGILPIEQMSDCDLYRFYPYSAYFDRIPKYTYYALFNDKS
jgi:hypothetical protein